MSGSIYLYISNKGEVFKVPKPKYSIYKAVPHLANEEVLIVILFYETLNRKPHELDLVSFHRAHLDNKGVYKISQEEITHAMLNFKNYAFSSVESLSLRSEPLPIPIAPNNSPTDVEKNALYTYIKEKYPTLWSNCPYLVEQHIKSIEKHYSELKTLVKEAYKLKTKEGYK